jgi:hypothetical protein
MSRRKIIRSLPPLIEAIPDFNGFSTGQNQFQSVLNILRVVSERFRTDTPQIFYAMRDVMKFFDIPLRTVAQAYEVLEREGLLNRIRSSRTLLSGKENVLSHSIRGVVGLPILLDMFVFSSVTRHVNIALEERLRSHGFVADFIFHVKKQEETTPDFAERLLNHQLDIIIWQNPDSNCLQNILALRDYGVRILVIQTTEAKANQPAVTYIQNWKPAYHKLGDHWRKNRIDRVLLPMNFQNLAYESEFQIFKSIMADAGLMVEPCSDDPTETLRKCKALSRKHKVAIGFVELPTANRFCNQEPLIAEKLAQMSSLAFCRGPLFSPYLQDRGIRPDVVAFPPIETVVKIVEDIQVLPTLKDEIRHTFEAQFWAKADFESPWKSQ